MAKSLNLQDMFLNQARKEGVPVTIYLSGGASIKGQVRGFDAFTVIIDTPGKPSQLVYKHGILSIVPSENLQSFREGPPE
ncbi:MAG: RNA chaperone Hfq [Fimbriimonadaceae bacterium]|jgi:host factor-I protein